MVLHVIFNSVPEEIKRFKNWVLWRLEERDGKNTKIPYQRNGRRADTTNPDTWDTYNYIESTGTKSDGIGFVFSEDTGIMGIDWDKVRDPISGEWDEEAFEEILSLRSYAELSQSGTGAHVLIKGTMPGVLHRNGNIEMYSKDRFFVVTGERITGMPTEIKENQEAINKLYEKHFEGAKKENKKNPTAKRPEKQFKSPKMSDDEVIDHCRKAANSDKFVKLYDKGEWKEFNYPSQSEADYALCFIMAFYTEDAKQLDKLFRKGALYREDWDRTSKYTLDRVLNKIIEVYSPGEKETGKQLSNQERELLTAAFKKMLLSDDDNAKEKNGVGFNKFDSEAIHEEMDGKTEIPAETLIKFAPKLKKYKKQLAVFGIDTADIEGIIKEHNKKTTEVEPKNVKVPFDIVAKEIMDNYQIFTTTDNKQMFLYQDGVYKNEGTEAILSTKIRDIHDQLYAEYWMSINQEFILEHIPKATTKYISEVFAYIQDYTYKSRDEIDKNADRYLNFKNGIFDIEKWELKEHTPDYLSVCQIPRIYDKKATCPQIEKFITETIDPNDEDFVFEWFGYNLTTDVSYESSLFVYGPQGTGKSLLLSLLNSFVGCNNCSAETLQNLEVKPSRVANLYGKRANICSEIPSTQIHQNEMFKKLTSVESILKD